MVGLDPLIFVGPPNEVAVDIDALETLHVLDADLVQAAGFAVQTIVQHDNRADFDAATLTEGGLGLLSQSRRLGRQALPLTDACRFIAAPNIVGFKTLDYPFANPIFIYAPERRQHPTNLRNSAESLRCRPPPSAAGSRGG